MAELHKWLKVPIYSARLCLVAGREHANMKFGFEGTENYDGFAAFNDEGIHTLVICSKDCYRMDILAHEATHVSWHTLDQMGIKLSADNHEAQTYLISWIMREAIKFFDKAFEDAEANTGKD